MLFMFAPVIFRLQGGVCPPEPFRCVVLLSAGYWVTNWVLVIALSTYKSLKILSCVYMVCPCPFKWNSFIHCHQMFESQIRKNSFDFHLLQAHWVSVWCFFCAWSLREVNNPNATVVFLRHQVHFQQSRHKECGGFITQILSHTCTGFWGVSRQTRDSLC